MEKREQVDKFDNKRRPLGYTRERHEFKEGEYMQAMHCWIVNSKGEFLFQKRSMLKDTHAGEWSSTGGGSDPGETTLETLVRECEEELGITVDLDNVELIMMYRKKVGFVDVYLFKADIDIKDIVMQETEVDEVKWATREEMEKMVEDGIFADNIANYRKLFFRLLKNSSLI